MIENMLIFCFIFLRLTSYFIWASHDFINGNIRLTSSSSLQYHGTTTLSFIFNDVFNNTNIIVAVDSRATISDYVGSRTVKKVLPVSERVIATMAGGAADCTHWIRRICRQVKYLEHQYQSKLSVGAISKLLSCSLRTYKGSGISVGTMLAGFSDDNNCQLYYVDAEGSCLSGKAFCVGSGSNLAYGIVDSENLGMITLENAIKIAKKAIYYASRRDGFSGGYINVFHVNTTGCFHVDRTDIRILNVNNIF